MPESQHSRTFAAEGKQLHPLTGPTIVPAIVVSIGLVGSMVALVATEGDPLATLLLPIVLTVAAFTVTRPDMGLIFLIFCTIFFDQFDLGFEAVTYGFRYFRNIQGILLTPFELHFLLVVSAFALKVVLEKRFSFCPIPAGLAALATGGILLFGVLYGLLRGGDFTTALWEVRALFYLLALYFIAPQLLRTKEQLMHLITAIIIGVSFKALQGISRYVASGFRLQATELLISGEDIVWAVDLTILFITLWALGYHKSIARYGKWILPIFLLALYASQRRISFVGLGVSLTALPILLPIGKRKTATVTIAVVFLAFGLYLAAFWDLPYARGANLAQQVKSIIITDPQLTSRDNYLSNLYREYEAYNLAYTARHHPMIGVGFGMKYMTPLSWYGLEQKGLLPFIPHNGVMWLLVKVGWLGMIAPLLFFHLFIYHGVQAARKHDDPFLVGVAIFCVLALLNQLIVVVAEMHLSFYRNMALLGTFMAIVPIVNQMAVGSGRHASQPQGTH